MSIRRRLFLAMAAIVALGFALAGHWLIDDLRPRHLATMEESLVDTAHVLAAVAARHWGDADAVAAALDAPAELAHPATVYEVEKRRFDLRILVTDDRGVVVVDLDGDEVGADHSQWNNVLRTLRGTYGARATRQDPAVPSSTVLHVSAPVVVDGATVGVLTVAKPEATIDPFLATTRRTMILALVYVAAGMVLLGVLMSAWATNPIRRLCAHVERSGHDRHARLPHLGPSDIAALGRAFEQLRDRLEGRRYVEHYVQALTHELKSPLTALRGTAELLAEDPPVEHRRRFLATIEREVARCNRLLDQLFTLAELERRQRPDDLPQVDCAALTAQVVAAHRSAADTRKITVASRVAEHATVRGEAPLLELALGNLLANAIAHAPAASRVTLTCEVANDQVAWRVRDQGPGIPDWARERVFERFFSLPGNDGGKSTGLGLPLVAEIADLHRGEARVEAVEGGGTEAVFILPRA